MDVDVIGQTAGQVWDFLRENPNASRSAIERASDARPWVVHMAMGWLAREGKLQVTQKGRITQFWLTEE